MPDPKTRRIFARRLPVIIYGGVFLFLSIFVAAFWSLIWAIILTLDDFFIEVAGTTLRDYSWILCALTWGFIIFFAVLAILVLYCDGTIPCQCVLVAFILLYTVCSIVAGALIIVESLKKDELDAPLQTALNSSNPVVSEWIAKQGCDSLESCIQEGTEYINYNNLISLVMSAVFLGLFVVGLLIIVIALILLATIHTEIPEEEEDVMEDVGNNSEEV